MDRLVQGHDGLRLRLGLRYRLRMEVGVRAEVKVCPMLRATASARATARLCVRVGYNSIEAAARTSNVGAKYRRRFVLDGWMEGRTHG